MGKVLAQRLNRWLWGSERRRDDRTLTAPRRLCAIATFELLLVAVTSSPASEAAISSQAQSLAVDTLFVGQILTLDEAQPKAEAMAVSGGRIVAIGSRAQVDHLVTMDTRKITINGVAIPGFADAHVHVAGVGQQLERLNLRGLTKPAVLSKVAAAARSARPGTWIFGEGWDQGFWTPAVFPTAKDLDGVSAGHPVILSRIDGHSSWVNSKALALAKISHDTADPDGGRIVRGTSGDPTGIFVDEAQDLIHRIVPKPTLADRQRHIRSALQQLARWGLTSVHDAAVDLDTIAIYKELVQEKQLPIRVYVMASGDEARKHYLATGPELHLGKNMLTIRSFKLFADGALGSRGAELTEPYTDAPQEHGLELMKDSELGDVVRAARQKGFQVNVHAIGDRAVQRVLDAFTAAGVTPEERFRIEHASMVPDADVSRFRKFGIIASIQPVFVGEYSRWAEDRVGPSRAHWVLRTRDLLNAGAVVAAGTDYPASDSGSPIDNLYCAVTRRGANGKPEGGWYSDERVNVEEALHMMTTAPAYAAFQENDIGALKVGKYADFTVLSANPFQIPAKQLQQLRVRMTVVAGHVIFSSR